MLDTVPTGVPLGSERVAAAIDTCLRCTQSCTTCADADLVEDDIDEMRDCIALCLNCADVCALMARLLSRPAHSDEYVIHRLLQACVRVCTTCAEECAGTRTITVTAPCPRPYAGRACAPVRRCSTPRRSRTSRSSPAPDAVPTRYAGWAAPRCVRPNRSLDHPSGPNAYSGAYGGGGFVRSAQHDVVFVFGDGRWDGSEGVVSVVGSG